MAELVSDPSTLMEDFPREKKQSFSRWCSKGLSQFNCTFSDRRMAQFWPNICTMESNGTSHQCNRKHLHSPSKAATEAADRHCKSSESELKLRPLGILLSFQSTFSLNSIFLRTVLWWENSGCPVSKDEAVRTLLKEAAHIPPEVSFP